MQQIYLCKEKLPVTSSGGLRIKFQWTDAFLPSRSYAEYSWTYETACILFNLGALESVRGIRTDRSSNDGIKNCAKHMMLASGLFSYLRTQISNKFTGRPTVDMTPEGLQLLSLLMQAQAQACFYQMAFKNNMPQQKLAQLAMGAGNLYGQAAACMRKEDMS